MDDAHRMHVGQCAGDADDGVQHGLRVQLVALDALAQRAALAVLSSQFPGRVSTDRKRGGLGIKRGGGGGWVPDPPQEGGGTL